MFLDFKTPSMGECEQIGHELGLSKRVVQVWFQNARSKEKKGKPVVESEFGNHMADGQLAEGINSCQYCPELKFSNSSAYRDHLFGPRHVQAVKISVSAKVREENGYTYAVPVPIGYETPVINNNNYSRSEIIPQMNGNTTNICASVVSPISAPMDLTTKAV